MVGGTSRSNGRVRRRPSTAISNVCPVRRRRQCCTQRVDHPRQPIFGYDVARDQLGVGGPSLGAWRSEGCPSEVVDDVAILVDFQHGLELSIGEDVHSVRQRIVEMHLDVQVAVLYQMEVRRHRKHRGSGQRRRRCSRVESRYESFRSLHPAAPFWSR